jgi:regulator of sigma E protease
MLTVPLDIQWQAVGLQAAQLTLSLSILVILHELGHFLPARLFGCRVEKFYLFFDPWFSLFRRKVGETEYGIGWLPLGGYVKISGMVDESMDKEQLSKPAAPWEFRSKPAWQRLIIMVGGVTMNILLAFFIYAMTLWVWGERKLPLSGMRDGVWCVDSLALELGLRTGDRILAVNGEPVTYFEELNAALLVGERVTVEREGRTLELTLPANLIGKLVESGRRAPMVMPRIPAIVAEVSDTGNARHAGLLPGDRITAIDDKPIRYFDQVKPVVQGRDGDTVRLEVQRGGRPRTLATVLGRQGAIGFFPEVPGMDDLERMGLYRTETRTYGFFESFPAGTRKAIGKLGDYIAQFRKIIDPSTGAYKGIGGFKSMGSIFPREGWDWQVFWNITAFFSIMLAFMNLLPIPALDGGHVMFTLYEIVTGRKPSDRFLEYAQIVGMVLLFALLIYANANDIFGWGRNR